LLLKPTEEVKEIPQNKIKITITQEGSPNKVIEVNKNSSRKSPNNSPNLLKEKILEIA
jgi:hypothetical protein